MDLMKDLQQSFKAWRIWILLNLREMKLDYRRTLLGPWWYILNNLFAFIPICFLYKNIVKAGNNYYLYVASGLIIWNFISQSLQQSANTLLHAASYIKEIKMPFFTFILKIIVKNLMIFLHSFICLILFLIYFKINISYQFLFIFPFMLVISFAILTWGLTLSMCTVYFRDLNHITPKLFNLLFLITPILWEPSILSANKQRFVALNPFTSIINMGRNIFMNSPIHLQEMLPLLFFMLLGMMCCYITYYTFRNKLVFFL